MAKRFSIIIPTRERHETLGATIKTVINQDFDDFEIIIADNFSSFPTKKVVETFISDKVRYFRTDSSLSMTDNWEFALSKSNGEYVIILGDDDGLIEGALTALNSIIVKTSNKLIRWERAYYSWPNMEPTVFANKLHVKFDKANKIVDGHQLINEVINFNADYRLLPMLYNSAVHSSLIESTIKSTGRFFHSTIPDVFSGFALAYLAGEFVSIGIPMSINAGSAKSNGASFLYKSRSETINNDFQKLNDESEIIFDMDIPFVRSFPIAIIEPYIKYLKVIRGSDSEYDYLKAYVLIIKSLICYDKEELYLFAKIIKDKAVQKNLDLDKIQSELNSVMLSNIDEIVGPKTGFKSDEVVLDAAEFGLKDVFDVSVFVNKFYDFKSFEDENFKIQPDILSYKKMSLKMRIRKVVKIIFMGKV